MASLSIIFLTIISLLWMAITSLILIRIPRCNTIPKPWKWFIAVFLILQIIKNGFQIYDLLVKENIIKQSSGSKQNIVIDKSILISMNRLSLVSFFYYLTSLFIMIFLYYIIFQSIFVCNDKVISNQLVWMFVVLTILQYGSITIAKPNVEQKLMMNAL